MEASMEASTIPAAMPELLISAADEMVARSFLNELTENDLEEDADSLGVWRLRNKYYTAPVRLRFSADGPAGPANPPEAHVVVLGAGEWARGEALLAARARPWAAAASVRLCALCGAGAQTPARRQQLRRAAAHLGLEPVALPADSDDDDADNGWRRARDALHAHRWPGLRMRTSTEEAREDDTISASADDALRRAELLGSALAALGAGGRPAGGSGGVGPPDDETAAQREARLQRAEALVHAFCLALADEDSDP